MTEIIQPTSISITRIKEDIVSFIQSKPERSRWKDFYESSTGTMLIELLSAMGTYISYQNFIARREAYLFDARIRSSNVAIAETLGYPVYRGKNEHIVLTILPTETAVLDKFAVVGQCLDKDIVTLAPLNIVYDQEISFEVAIGNLKEVEKTMVSDQPTNFRFSAANISEDYVLTLDGTELPVSKEILDLINDYYVVLTNSWDSIDVLYLNRKPPENWVSNLLYNNGQYVTPDFSWRESTSYSVGNRVTPTVVNGLYYECTQAGNTSDTEPIWPSEISETVEDNEVIWECKGGAPERFYFRSVSVGTAYSGSNEPIWPMELGAQIVDNEVLWQCFRDYTFSQYPYETGSILGVKYIELSEVAYTEQDIDLFYGGLLSTTLENSYSSPESIEDIKINASLYHETERVIKGRNDYKKIFRQLLPNSVDTNGHDVSPAVVELSYAKDHTTRLWEPRIYVQLGEAIMPSVPNNFIYVSLSAGYTEIETKGTSGLIEPTWPTTVGETVLDGQVLWQCLGSDPGGYGSWEAETVYNINDRKVPTVPNTFYYGPQEFFVEPVWPTTLEEEIVDNEVTWKCTDTIFLKGYEASKWEVDTEVLEDSFIIPIVSQNFFYRALNTGLTGADEPVWPKVIGETVVDNAVTWECFDLIDAEKYQKNRALDNLASYRPFGVEPPTIEDPKIVFVSLNISLVVNTTDILLTIAETDVDAILEKEERTLYGSLDVNDIEFALERLSYVKVARVTVTKETKSQTWESYKLYRLRDVVIPTVPNAFYYESYYNRDAKEEGYSQGDQLVYSQGTEPVWPTVLGETVTGGNNHIIWECVDIPVEVVEDWSRNKLYALDDIITPTVSTGYAYKVASIINLEPVWPTVLGESVVDGAVYWVCKDPTLEPPQCDWNEYYIVGRKVTLNR